MSRDLAAVSRDLTGAREELHAAQATLAMLLVDDEPKDYTIVGGLVFAVAPRTGIQIARGIIERDLAARRVEAWSALLDRLRAEARALGLFDQ